MVKATRNSGEVREDIIIRNRLFGLFQRKISHTGTRSYMKILQEESEPENIATSLETSFRDVLSIQASGAHDKALTLWADIKDRYPDFSYSYAAHAITQAMLGNLAEAEIEISAALIKFPHDIETTAIAIQISIMNAAWNIAMKRLECLRRNFPHAPYTLNNATIVERTISAGKEAYYAGVTKQAHAAEAADDWQNALAAWQVLFSEFSTERSVILGLTRSAETLEQYELSESTYEIGLTAHPDDFELRAKFAQLAAKQQNWPQAAERWIDNLSHYQGMDGYADLAVEAYLQTDRAELAESLLDEVTKKYPDRLDFWLYYAKVAEKLGRWRKAVTGWDHVLELKPDIFFEKLRAEAVWHAGMQAIETDDALPRSNEPLVLENDAKKLMLNFENLCGNCQMGLVQRHYGAEPLGLFRFASVTAERIIFQLDEHFSSLGDPKHLFVEASDVEYIVRDDRGYYLSHTYLNKMENSHEQVLQQQIKRIKYLKRELMDDLEQSAKIFVCMDPDAPISDNTLFALLSAVSKYGDNTILGIRIADENNPRGSTKSLNHRTLIGYVGEPINFDTYKEFDWEGWLDIMREALKFKSEQTDILI